MTDWPTVVSSLASLIAGGGIAIVGQSLTDRRANRRGREARHEDYRVNYFFTVQREALMKVQDIVASISSEISVEWTRQSQAAERAKFNPATIEPQMSKISDLWKQLAPIVDQMPDASSEEEKESLENEAAKITSRAREIMNNLAADIETMRQLTDMQVEILQAKINPLHRELENYVIRAGSPTIAAAAREYQEAARDYNNGFGYYGQGSAEAQEKEKEARDRLQNTVGEALKSGPFEDHAEWSDTRATEIRQ